MSNREQVLKDYIFYLVKVIERALASWDESSRSMLADAVERYERDESLR